jgi:hypothetical protein
MQIKYHRLINLTLSAACLFTLAALGSVHAADNSGVIVIPSIIDSQAEIRDILEYGVTIKNTSQVKAELYPFVNDLKKNEGEQPFINPADLDKTVSLARWIEVSRAVIELMPGEEKTVPVKISVNPAAIPGMYFAAITFGLGSNRDLAEQNRLASNQPELLINLEIKDHVIEKAESGLFSTEHNININHRVNFLFSVRNIGNKPIKPLGSIIVYDRRGSEVAALPINQEEKAIESQATESFKLSWGGGKTSGQFKAMLRLEYGDSRKDINDTIYFWLMPWELLVLFSVLILAVIISFWLLIRHNRQLLRLSASRQTMAAYQPPSLPIVINLKDRK